MLCVSLLGDDAPKMSREQRNNVWKALFVDSVSTNCDLFVNTLPDFRPAKVA